MTCLLYSLTDGVACLSFNRPERLNALSVVLADGLSKALDRAVADGARAVLLTGEGRAFCSGADLTEFPPETFAAGIRARFDDCYTPMFARLADLPIPIVTAINGPAVGAGCSIALLGDLTVAAASAYLSTPFALLGAVPDGGATWLLPRLIGLQRANTMMMLGEQIDAEKAAAWGMIHAVVADDALAAEAWSLARRLATGATRSLGAIRASVRALQAQPFEAALAREAEDQVSAFHTRDFNEGLRAFLERRSPRYVGE